MSYEIEQKRAGREPFQIIEIDLDYCSRSYGVGPCTAASSDKCYNTRATCQDTANYNKTIKIYTFCTNAADLPVGLNAIPCIKSVSTSSQGDIAPGKGLGERISRKITMIDLSHNDRGVDPYVDERGYSPIEQGTYFGKLIARNLYYEGRTVRIKSGYRATPFNSADFETRTYVIDKIERKKNLIVFTVTDLLRLADNDRAQCPAPSNGALLSDITAGAGSLTLTPAGIGNDEYAASGRGRIGDELVDFTRSGDAVTLTVRGAGNTTAAAHTAADTFQECKVWTTANIVDIVYELLNTYAGIDASYIPNATDWADEKARWLSAATATTTISEPTGVLELLGEILEQYQINVWQDDRANKIKLKANMPLPANATPETLTESKNLIKDSVSIEEQPKQRLSQVWIYWNPYDLTETKKKNYKSVYVSQLPNKETADQYNSSRIKVFVSRWFDSEGRVSAMAGRLLNRFGDNPKLIKFKIDAKDSDINVGDTHYIESQDMQRVDGSKETHRAQIVSIAERKLGSVFDVEALTANFSGRYGYISQTATPDYSSATDAEKDRYGFISEALGANFSDGGEAYKII